MAVRGKSAVAACAILFVVLQSGTSSGQNLSLTGTPALNNALTLTLTGPPGAAYFIGISTSPGPTVTPLGPLALGLPIFILVQSDPAVPFTPVIGPGGQLDFTFSIPNFVFLIGTTYYLQALYTDPSAPFLFSLTNGVSFTILNPISAPQIGGITPTAGSAAGGTSVTITGNNFQLGNLNVTLAGNQLQNVQTPDAQTITGTTPPGTPGTTADLVVSTLGGSAFLSAAFAYLPEPPSIAAITPNHAQIGGGSLITITGTGLGPGTDIYVAGNLLAPLTQTLSQITAFAPPFGQFGLVDVVATSSQGLQVLPASFRYTIALNTGDGTDGPFNPTANTALDTTSNTGIFNFTTVNIPAGVTVTGTGPFAIRLRCQGSVVIDGTVDISGEDGQPGSAGGAGGGSGPGGHAGGDGEPTVVAGAQPGAGPGAGGGNSFGDGGHAAHGTVPPGNCLPAVNTTNGSVYGSPNLVPLSGGSGGGGSEFFNGIGGAGGGGGGGALSIVSAEDIIINGTIKMDGGDAVQNNVIGTFSRGGAGSGGAISLRSQGHIVISGPIYTRGGLITGTIFRCGGTGRWFLENWLGQTASGVLDQVPTGVY